METFKDSQFEIRKKDHIRYALSEESQSIANEDWNRIQLLPEALPELNLNEVTLNTESLGRSWKNPYFVSSMTAGHSDSLKINSILAEACQEESWLLGIGSQRKEIEDPTAVQEWVQLRKRFPRVLLASNIGLTQLIQTPINKIKKLVEETEAIALFIHTNPLQECLQIEGTPQFRGGLSAIEKLVKEINLPIIVKEVGSGISPETIRKLIDVGVFAVDISGRGGTHWGRVEGMRSPSDTLQAQAAHALKDWGISTPRALYLWSEYLSNKEDRFPRTTATTPTAAPTAAPKTTPTAAATATPLSPWPIIKPLNFELWASGGVRNGLQAAKCLALGANRVGLARPFLEAALRDSDAVRNLMSLLEYELRVSLFCLGVKNINELKQRKVWTWEKV